LDALDKKIESFPDGRIKIKKCKSGVYYYLSIKGKKDRLLAEKDNDLIRDLIQKSYLRQMDDDTYLEDLVQRVNYYNEEGIIQGDRLFFSFETAKTPLDVRTIDNLINRHFR
jgi:hypothetical protein